MNRKSQLRIYYKNQRKIFSSAPLDNDINLLLFDFLKNNFLNHIIGAYYPKLYEVNILSTLEKLLNCSTTIALPRLEKNVINFYQYTKLSSLTLNHFNILEPLPQKLLYPSVILTPLVAVDLQGNRLGYGKGYYDRYFATSPIKTIKIGICYETQVAAHIPKETHDITLDFLVTENNIYYCKRNKA